MAGAFTIPSRLARPAQISQNAGEARQRVIQLYRDWYRSAPEIVSTYSLNMSPAYVRQQIRKKFERNRHVTDQRAIDVLLLKSRQDYQETINIWKMPDHVHGLLLNEKEVPQKTFLQKFYEGRDEEAVKAAATGTV